MSSVHDFRVPAAPGTGTDSPKFPATEYADASSFFDAYAEETVKAWKTVDSVALDRAAEILLEIYARGGRVFSCGNGGSASVANHLQCDHVKGCRTGTDLAPRVVSLSANMELFSAIANDLGYENVFVYQLQSQSGPGDALIAISSSGRSANIVHALTWAREHGLSTIALTGFEGGAARTVADVAIHVDAANYGIVEDMHQAVMHGLAQYIRQSRMTSEAISVNVF